MKERPPKKIAPLTEKEFQQIHEELTTPIDIAALIKDGFLQYCEQKSGG